MVWGRHVSVKADAGGNGGSPEQVLGLEDSATQPSAAEPSPRGSARRWLIAAAWIIGLLALTAVYTRVSQSSRIMSDGATQALQGWDLLHGHLRLHGWEVSDNNFYFFEVPAYALGEVVFGLGDLAQHAASAFIYMLVSLAALGAALAGSQGKARWARGGVLLAVLAAPLFTGIGYLELQEPDHIGAAALIIAAFLLVDRFRGRLFTALLLVFLSAAQFDDNTVRYVAVVPIVLVCGYRALKARDYRGQDALNAYAAVLSVPASMLFTKVFVHFGGFTTPPLWQGLAPASTWIHHLPFAAKSIFSMYGAYQIAGFKPGSLAVYGFVCLFLALVGFIRVLWTWRRASTVEKLLFLAVVVNVGMFIPSGFATEDNAHEVAFLLPAGAVLAARLVPARLVNAARAYTVIAVSALVAVVALAFAAHRPNFPASKAPLAAFLEAHHLTNGLSGYDEANTATALSGGKVHIVSIHPGGDTLAPNTFNSNFLWYDPKHFTATFAIADAKGSQFKTAPSVYLHYFGQPVQTYHLDQWTIMVYNRNLLKQLSKH